MQWEVTQDGLTKSGILNPDKPIKFHIDRIYRIEVKIYPENPVILLNSAFAFNFFAKISVILKS